MKEIVHIENVSRKPLFKASANLMTEIFTVARTKYKPDFLPLKSVCPLPDFNQKYELNFTETALIRAQEIWKNNTVNNEVNVLWSGGIDSTVALVALIQTAKVTSQFNVFCNLNSINENPALYAMLLQNKKVSFKNSSIMPRQTSMQLITGELGDQIFGSDLLFKIVNTLGFSQLHVDFDVVLPKVFKMRCGEELGQTLYERYRPIIEEAPFKLKTAFDFIWWWNLTQKWQSVKFRKNCLLNSQISTLHFFESDNFQLWSVNNHSRKIKDSVQSYKMPAKEFIFEFDKNSDYLLQKRKYGSPFGNKFHFLALYDDGTKICTWEECDQLINALTPHIIS